MPKGKRGLFGGGPPRRPSRSFSPRPARSPSRMSPHRRSSIFRGSRPWRRYSGPWYRPSSHHSGGISRFGALILIFVFIVFVLPLLFSIFTFSVRFSFGPFMDVDFDEENDVMTRIVPITSTYPETKSVREEQVTLASEEFFYETFDLMQDPTISLHYEMGMLANITVLLLTSSQFTEWVNFRQYTAISERVVHNVTTSFTLNGELGQTNYVVLYNDPHLNSGNDVMLSIIEMEATVAVDRVVGYTTIVENNPSEMPSNDVKSHQSQSFIFFGLLVIVTVIVGVVSVMTASSRKKKKIKPSSTSNSSQDSVKDSSILADSGQVSFRCPECHGDVKPDDNFCINCGFLLSSP